MKVSIITACNALNNDLYDCIHSINSQTYNDIEHIFVDGTMSKGFRSVIEKESSRDFKIVEDNVKGIYPALNQGIKNCTGDIIGILHSDDFLASKHVISNIAKILSCDSIDLIYGDLDYVDKKSFAKHVRRWKSSAYNRMSFFMGWMPPHPTMYIKKSVYERVGTFSENYKISGDYEFILRSIFKNNMNAHYLSETLVKMRIGGASNRNFHQILKKMIEDHSIIMDYRLIPVVTLLIKNIRKIGQFF